MNPKQQIHYDELAFTPFSAPRRRYSTENLRRLINRAQNHPLGIEFFCKGYLESVAITFETDVFEVEAARALLNTPN
ncbi:hypothetical protein WDW89_18850 [Deltaproteobacteria bacterium TL4]